MAPTIILSVLSLITASFHIRAFYRGQRQQIYIFKPLTTTLIILIALIAPWPEETFYKVAVVVGLLFSLAGDIFLMLPNDRFLAGLVSFLIAHVWYTVAFTLEAGFTFSVGWLFVLILAGAIVLSLIWSRMGRMRIPALIYMLVILFMAWQAAGRWTLLQNQSALFSLVGALLFVLSDSILAVDRFRKRYRHAEWTKLGSYYAAQWFIALSVVALS